MKIMLIFETKSMIAANFRIVRYTKIKQDSVYVSLDTSIGAAILCLASSFQDKNVTTAVPWCISLYSIGLWNMYVYECDYYYIFDGGIQFLRKLD